MGAVAVAQHLHAMAAMFNYNNVTGGIERDARGIIELAGACSFSADGADMRAVAVAQHLNTMVAVIGYNKVAFAVKRDSIRVIELSIVAASVTLAADGANVRAVAQPKHLHTMVVVITNCNVALAVDGDASGAGELPVPFTCASDGANMAAVGIPQHLHAMTAVFNNNKVAGGIERDA